MALQTYTIELKVDATEEAHAALLALVKQSARDMLASGMLLSPGKAPQVIARTTDAFYSTDEIKLFDASGVLYD